jgi:Dirigent-like protein
MEFTAEFTVIGEDQADDEEDQLAPLPPGGMFSLDQDLFEETEEQSWNRGDVVGEAHGTVLSVRRKLAVCSITFAFENGTVVAEGLLPIDGQKLGSGALAVTGGTGSFRNSGGEVGVETRNPKRWSFVL